MQFCNNRSLAKQARGGSIVGHPGNTQNGVLLSDNLKNLTTCRQSEHFYRALDAVTAQLLKVLVLPTPRALLPCSRTVVVLLLENFV